MFAQGLQKRRVQEFGVAGAFEQVSQAVLEQLGRAGLQAQSRPDAAGDGQQVGFFQAVGQALVARQNDGQDGAGVQVGAGQQAQFAPSRGGSFPGLRQ